MDCAHGRPRIGRETDVNAARLDGALGVHLDWPAEWTGGSQCAQGG